MNKFKYISRFNLFRTWNVFDIPFGLLCEVSWPRSPTFEARYWTVRRPRSIPSYSLTYSLWDLYERYVQYRLRRWNFEMWMWIAQRAGVRAKKKKRERAEQSKAEQSTHYIGIEGSQGRRHKLATHLVRRKVKGRVRGCHEAVGWSWCKVRNEVNEK